MYCNQNWSAVLSDLMSGANSTASYSWLAEGGAYVIRVLSENPNYFQNRIRRFDDQFENIPGRRRFDVNLIDGSIIGNFERKFIEFKSWAAYGTTFEQYFISHLSAGSKQFRAYLGSCDNWTDMIYFFDKSKLNNQGIEYIQDKFKTMMLANINEIFDEMPANVKLDLFGSVDEPISTFIHMINKNLNEVTQAEIDKLYSIIDIF